MHDAGDVDRFLRHRRETWDEADMLEALDELAALLAPDPDTPCTREERDAFRAAREDWQRDSDA
jgi:hypothetical protein